MRRVCVFTGSRADYGPLSPLIQVLRKDEDVELSVLASGGHLVPEQGMTIRELVDDGLDVVEQVEMVLASDSAGGTAKSLGVGMIGYVDVLERLSPELFVVLGDRYEALGACLVAVLQGIPVLHIAGGTLTYGAVDDSIRHAITKLASLHATSTSEFRQRIIQLGEHPSRVHEVGALGLDTVRTIELLTRDELCRRLGLPRKKSLFTLTYHAETATAGHGDNGALAIVQALDSFPSTSVVITGSNVDFGGRQIAAIFGRYASRQAARVKVISSLGRLQYLSLLAHSDVVIGNSSSALIEAPAVRTPTVNVGGRQDGRPRAPSVIDCEPGVDAVVDAIRQALTVTHRKLTAGSRSPYGDGRASARVVELIKKADLSSLRRKEFFDLPGEWVEYT